MFYLQNQISVAEQLKALSSFFQLAQQPANFEALYDLDAILRKTQFSNLSLNYLKSQPEVAQIIEERYLSPVPDLEQLLQYPQDSLGYIWANHLKVNQFQPDFYRKYEITNDISYVTLRRSQTHDIYHVITGFDTSIAGELGLQAFQLAQMRSPLAVAIIVSGILNGFHVANELEKRIEQIYLGWQIGLKAKPCFAQKWEQAWEKPVEQWRSELNVKPVNAFHSNVAISLVA